MKAFMIHSFLQYHIQNHLASPIGCVFEQNLLTHQDDNNHPKKWKMTDEFIA
jgi:hypothetical protein